MNRLIIDTAAGLATAVLARDETVLGVASSRGSMLSLLHANIQQVSDSCDFPLTNLDEVHVVIGPGSWSGLHVSVTSAKTLAQFLDVPLVGLSLLDALSYTYTAADLRVLALLDAKRGHVYSAGYEPGDGGSPRGFAEPAKRSVAEAVETTWDGVSPIALVGDDEMQKVVAAELPPGLAHPTRANYPSPEAFARLAHARTESRVIGEERLRLTPDYMQEDLTIMPSSQKLR